MESTELLTAHYRGFRLARPRDRPLVVKHNERVELGLQAFRTLQVQANEFNR